MTGRTSFQDHLAPFPKSDYMHARYYSSDLGRFLSVDPVGGKVGSSQSWNRYSYVLNSPIGYRDPDGKEVLTATAVGAGAVVGWPVVVGAGVGVAGGYLIGHMPVYAGHGQTVAEWWADQYHTVFSKGGRQNIRDSGLQNLTDEQIATELADPNTTKDRKRKLQKEQKARGQRNKQKRDSGKKSGGKGSVVVVPLEWSDHDSGSSDSTDSNPPPDSDDQQSQTERETPPPDPDESRTE